LGTETDRLNELETRECSVVETPRPRRKPGKRGLLAQPQENLWEAGMVGGAIRTRTMDPLGWVREICPEKSRLPDRPTLSRPGTAGAYWGHSGYKKPSQRIAE
jgi:hypothetical protein